MTIPKTFKEVLDELVDELAPNLITDKYFELLKAHNREMTELKDAILDRNQKLLDEFVEKHKT